MSRNRTIVSRAYRGIDRAGSATFRWMTTDHTGFGDALNSIPSGLGFWEKLKFSVIMFVISIIGALLSGFVVFLMIAYGLPWFLFGSLPQ